jgi:hypothetical protein
VIIPVAPFIVRQCAARLRIVDTYHDVARSVQPTVLHIPISVVGLEDVDLLVVAITSRARAVVAVHRDDS